MKIIKRVITIAVKDGEEEKADDMLNNFISNSGFTCEINNISNRSGFFHEPTAKSGRVWTKDEETFLTDNWEYKTADEIATALNRSKLAVTTKYWHLINGR